jgi:hypothetical protein
VLGIVDETNDTHLVLKASTSDDRYFPPLLAAQLLLDVGGLVKQNCFSKPGAGAGAQKAARRWAFAQEIFSNQGRGTEAGHFLEHLILEMLLLHAPKPSRKFTAETSWNFIREPDVYRLRFRKTNREEVATALAQSIDILHRRNYHIQCG